MTSSDSSSLSETPEPGPGLVVPDDKGYQVLARKYRPQCFEDLIGQEPMVRTLTNAFASDRVAHAFMLTGVRGVGKTTTARLLARALNYQTDDVKAPSILLNPPGVHCAAIAASRHMDVLEMDAASHTGISDIREILDSVRYAPVSARYKVYIIDEVHMLSTSAFNALLKTLEEPPPHAKFIFATTEIRKVPVTVLSRCQRFDLARIGKEQLVSHLQDICEKEGAQVAPDGLALIARAGEGSVRDALSILDQALVQEDGKQAVTSEAIRTMLGLADRTRVLDLFAMAARGDAGACCTELYSQFAAGADPLVILRDLLDHCHQCTRTSIMGDDAALEDYGDSAKIIRTLGKELSLGQLARLWQMLLMALDEARRAPDPLSATEMALIRICTAASLPGPEEAARLLRDSATNRSSHTDPSSLPTPPVSTARPQARATGNAAPAVQRHAETAPEPENEAKAQLHSLEDVVSLLSAHREMHLSAMVRRCVRLVSFRPGSIVFEPEPDAPANLAPKLTRFLQDQTDDTWLISLDGKARGAPTLAEQKKQKQKQWRHDIEQSPQMQDILKVFPAAKIVSIKKPGGQNGDTP